MPNLKLSVQFSCRISFTDEEHRPALYTLPHLGQKKLVRKPGTGIYLGTLTGLNKDKNQLESNLLHLERGSEGAGKKDECLPHLISRGK